jgi:regulator of sigma E protease
VFGLIDAVSANGYVVLTVTEGKDGPSRAAKLQVGDGEDRRKLTEPMALFNGLGFQFWEPPVPAVVARIEAASAAEKAGLKLGDRLLEANGRPLDDFFDLLDVTSKLKPGDTLALRYERGGSEFTASAVLTGQSGSKRGFLGVGPAVTKLPADMIVTTELTPYSSLTAAAAESWNMTVLQARLVWRMVMGNVSLKNLSGPLSIAEFAGESASAGVGTFLNFLVMISLSLGFLNLLPIPILDGGQVVFQLVEWLKGSPLSERAQAFSQQIGIALLILIMGVALYNDVARQIGPQIVASP